MSSKVNSKRPNSNNSNLNLHDEVSRKNLEDIAENPPQGEWKVVTGLRSCKGKANMESFFKKIDRGMNRRNLRESTQKDMKKGGPMSTPSQVLIGEEIRSVGAQVNKKGPEHDKKSPTKDTIKIRRKIVFKPTTLKCTVKGGQIMKKGSS